jgi:hypothetical protein
MIILSVNSGSNKPGNTKGGSITVPLTSCLTGMDKSVLQIKTKIVNYHTGDFKPVKTGSQQYSDASPFSMHDLNKLQVIITQISPTLFCLLITSTRLTRSKFSSASLASASVAGIF